MGDNVNSEGTALNRREALRFALLVGAVAGASLLLAGRGGTDEHIESRQAPVEAQAPMPNKTEKSVGEFSTEPVWNQDFSLMTDGSIDSRVWRYELDPEVPGYNNEAQAYTNSTRNVRVEGGTLVIEAHREQYTYPNDPGQRTFGITSGRIDTRDSLNFEFGKFEVTMKLPAGKGTWPAFWFLSANQPHTSKLNPSYEDWGQERFYMHDGELDAMEAYGNEPGIIEATLHTYDKSIEARTAVPDATDAFHTYGVEVTPTKVVWTVDGKPYQTFNKPSGNPDEWPFGNGNQLYAILNLAMGGSGGGKIDSSVNEWRMEIASARFYAYTKTE